MIKKQLGFTLIELLVVSTIIIVLTALGLTTFIKAGQNGRNAKRKADLETVRSALMLYRSDNGAYPTSSDFNDVVNDNLADYLSEADIEDPKGTGNYVYSYNSAAGADFTLEARLEPDETVYSLESP